MSRFEACLAYVLSFEGGYINNPLDRGGATAYGITQSTYNAWLSDKQLPLEPVAKIDKQSVTEIYRERYWDKCRCDSLPPRLDLCVFDSAVQHGVARAVKWLQTCAKTEIDGICGDQTIYAVHGQCMQGMLDDVIRCFLKARAALYSWIVEHDPSQSVFSRGWAARLDYLRSIVFSKKA
jgi:lysozyme family protein